MRIGFSTLELLVVLTLLAALALLSTPAFRRNNDPHLDRGESAQTLCATAAVAKRMARREWRTERTIHRESCYPDGLLIRDSMPW